MKRAGSAIAVLAALIIVALGSAALAASGGHGDEHGGGSEKWTLLAFTVTNFLIFLFLMRRFTGKPLRDFLLRRRQEVEEALGAASRAKAEAEAVKREYEEKEQRLGQHKQVILDEVRAIAEADGKRLRAAAEESAERMLADAERTAASDLERSKRELRAEAARLAAELARKRVRGEIDAATSRRLLDEFLEGVGR
ncbi:MAG: ATP synthase F0 subunit B [Deltaproteobacteria bacterium]